MTLLRHARHLAHAAALTLFAVTAPALAQEPIRIGSLPRRSPARPRSSATPSRRRSSCTSRRSTPRAACSAASCSSSSYDYAGDAEKARTFAKRLIEQDKVDVIVGGSTTGETMAAVPLVEAAGMPFISLAGAVVIVEPVKKWVFKTPHTDRMACDKIFVDMKARGATKAALISGSGGFDKSMRAECLKVAPNRGVEIVADETYGAADTDMTAQLTKIRGSSAQAVLNAGFGQGPAIVTRNYRQVGLTLPLYQSHGVASKEYIKLSGDAAEWRAPARRRPAGGRPAGRGRRPEAGGHRLP